MLRTVTRHPLVLSLAIALASLGIVGATAVTTGPATPVAARPSVAQARAALTRALRDMHTGPGRPAPGHVSPSTSGLTQKAFYNWAGYADDNSTGKTYTSVAGTWKQPKITCPTDEDRIAVWWVGLDGFNDSTVEQDGTFAWCLQGTVSYWTWWEMFPTNQIQLVSDAVAPGDKIVASVKYAAGNYTLKLTNSTNSASSFTQVETCQAPGGCLNSSAEWIAETVGTGRGYEPWPKFTTWKLTGAKATSGATNGVINTFPDDEITMVGTLGGSLGTPSALNAAGNAFSVTWNYAWS